MPIEHDFLLIYYFRIGVAAVAADSFMSIIETILFFFSNARDHLIFVMSGIVHISRYFLYYYNRKQQLLFINNNRVVCDSVNVTFFSNNVKMAFVAVGCSFSLLLFFSLSLSLTPIRVAVG